MAEEKTEKTRQFHFIKGPHFETRRAEGVMVEETPAGAVALTFYIGRNPLPRMVEYAMLEDGSVGDVVNMERKKGVVFELQQAVLLDPADARTLRDELTEFLEAKS